VTIIVNPCQVFSSSKTGGSVSAINYMPYSDGTVSQTFPTFTTNPACGYG